MLKLNRLRTDFRPDTGSDQRLMELAGQPPTLRPPCPYNLPAISKQGNMRFSIIIPTYNASEYIRQTIESVLNQSVSDWELIVVDDGSSDNTVQIAEKYCAEDARIRLVKQKNAGVGAARNFGFQRTSPDTSYIAFLDHDDVWPAYTLETLASELDKNAGVLAVHGDARYIDKTGRPIKPGEMEALSRERRAIVDGKAVNWPVDDNTTFAVMASWPCIQTPGQVLIRRGTLERVGLFDEAAVLPDVDMWLRISVHGDYAYIPKVVIDYRIHDTNESRKERAMTKALMRVRKGFIMSPMLSPEQRVIAKLGLRCWLNDFGAKRLSWAKDALRTGEMVLAARQLYHAARCYTQSLHIAISR
jgi:GT2 family glycosyltransferase